MFLRAASEHVLSAPMSSYLSQLKMELRPQLGVRFMKELFQASEAYKFSLWTAEASRFNAMISRTLKGKRPCSHMWYFNSGGGCENLQLLRANCLTLSDTLSKTAIAEHGPECIGQDLKVFTIMRHQDVSETKTALRGWAHSLASVFFITGYFKPTLSDSLLWACLTSPSCYTCRWHTALCIMLAYLLGPELSFSPDASSATMRNGLCTDAPMETKRRQIPSNS